MKHTYQAYGLSCKYCVHTVQKTVGSIEGVLDLKVTLDPPRTEITSEDSIDLEVINNALRDNGLPYRLGEMEGPPPLEYMPKVQEKVTGHTTGRYYCPMLCE